MSFTSVTMLEDEWLIVRNSGEIPEITYHASLYFLEKDPHGPAMTLSGEQKRYLKEAAVARYREIVLRDLQIENFSKTIYRGVRRTIYNWHRYQAFCARQALQSGSFKEVVGEALVRFLEQGCRAAGKELPEQFLNCSVEELLQFMDDIGVQAALVPWDIAKHCIAETGEER